MAKLLEPVVTAVVAVLQTNMPAYLAQIAAEYSDGVPLPNPLAYLEGEFDDVVEWPAVCAYGFSSDLLTPGNGWGHYEHQVKVRTLTRLEVHSHLYAERQMHRYALAAWRILYQNQTIGSPVVSLLPVNGQRLRSATEPRIRCWEWTLKITREDYP